MNYCVYLLNAIHQYVQQFVKRLKVVLFFNCMPSQIMTDKEFQSCFTTYEKKSCPEDPVFLLHKAPTSPLCD
jgi:hypothetical protein